jgi:hypothetical protein|tara:strand:- start:311 stop:508 length:198 start_codon:yes stop_codon:yes gene_type:complete
MKYHIVVHEITCKYTEVEAYTRKEAEEIARANGGTWLRLPLLLERKVVRTHDENEPHESPAEIGK